MAETRERVADALMQDMGYDLQKFQREDRAAYALARAAYLHFADVALSAARNKQPDEEADVERSS
jgi:nanoRNase/pAp phosphatase (c-di-AMP/oligoRNAs hydrolase)